MGGVTLALPAKRAEQYTGHVTIYVLLTVVIAGCGGLITGYDIGVTGGVVATKAFQLYFFPDLASETNHNTNLYCKLNEPMLTFFVSIMYLSGAFSCLLASYPMRWYGRRFMLMVSAFVFLVGVILQAAAQNLGMLIAGRVILGVGVGFALNAAPTYLIEVSPHNWRGGMTSMTMLAIFVGELMAQVINFHTAQFSTHEGGNGWRYSLGMAGCPAVVMLIGSFFITDSPGSQAEMGNLTQARIALQRIRGVEDVDAEFADLSEAAAAAALQAHPYKAICERRYRPQLVLSIVIPILMQSCGHLSIMSYGPQVFGAIGRSTQQALLGSVVTGAANIGGGIIMMFTLDKIGRRFFWALGGLQMAVGLAATAAIFAVGFHKYGAHLPVPYADAAVFTICLYVSAYAWGWGSLGYVYPQEIQTLETRVAGNGIFSFVQLLICFLWAQIFLDALCSLQYSCGCSSWPSTSWAPRACSSCPRPRACPTSTCRACSRPTGSGDRSSGSSRHWTAPSPRGAAPRARGAT